MAQAIASALAIYFVIWWVVLFAVLPFGIHTQQENGEVVVGTEPGAPVLVRMGRKLLWTTLISAIIFGCALGAYEAGFMNLDRMGKALGLPF